MDKGIIYVMTTAVPGLIKIGKTGSNNFEQRMYNLEHNGYRNVTALKRTFAIEVDKYDDKEAMLQSIFEKSRVSDTELFALDINIVTQLLSSFDGTVIYPVAESKEEIFIAATDGATSDGKEAIYNINSPIPNGKYYFKRKKKSDNKLVTATATVHNGRWIILKGSIFGTTEDIGGSQKAKALRSTLALDSNGTLLEDADLGFCTPSFAGNLVINQACNGWDDWYNEQGEPIDIYRKSK